MHVQDPVTTNRKIAKRGIQTYLEELCELPWALGMIRASGVSVSEVLHMMADLRDYGPEPRWTALYQRLQPQV